MKPTIAYQRGGRGRPRVSAQSAARAADRGGHIAPALP